MDEAVRALIVGAGIGGPAVAVFLRRLGYEVSLCERRPGVLAEGAFLAMAPNGMAVLAELGLAAAALERGTICTGFDFLNARGEHIGSIDASGYAKRFGHPMVMLERAAVHQIVVQAAERAGARLRFGASLTAIEQHDDRSVCATFTNAGTIDGDILLGCDGLRSRTRDLVLPSSPEPAFLGQLDFGGYVRGVDVPFPAGRNVMVFGRRAFFGAFRRPDGEVWWFHNGVGSADGSASSEAHRRRLLEEHAEDPVWIRCLIESTAELLGPWPLHDIVTLPRWHHGHVCLLGDAAHATSPSSGQGASLALEDALVLARHLRELGPSHRALATFVDARRARVERVAAIARRISGRKVPSGRFGGWMRDRCMPLFLRMGASANAELYAHRERWSDGGVA